MAALTAVLLIAMTTRVVTLAAIVMLVVAVVLQRIVITIVAPVAELPWNAVIRAALVAIAIVDAVVLARARRIAFLFCIHFLYLADNNAYRLFITYYRLWCYYLFGNRCWLCNFGLFLSYCLLSNRSLFHRCRLSRNCRLWRSYGLRRRSRLSYYRWFWSGCRLCHRNRLWSRWWRWCRLSNYRSSSGLCNRRRRFGNRNYRAGHRNRHFVYRGCNLFYCGCRFLGVCCTGNQHCSSKKWYKKFRHNIFFEEFVKAKI